MDLKHLIITAIVANAAKSGWEVTDGKSTAAYPSSYRGREAVRRGFRHITKPWFRTRYEDWKRANATARDCRALDIPLPLVTQRSRCQAHPANASET